METKKFFCHYIGNDDKPKRRSIELTKLTIQGQTLWGSPEDTSSYSSNNMRYELYMQLSDNVAVTCNRSISDTDWEEMNKTDRQFREEAERRSKENPQTWRDKDIEMFVSSCVRRRDNYIALFKKLTNLTDYLLNESSWVMLPQLAAYKEVNHPQYPALLEKRKVCEEARRQAVLQRQEENRKRREEEERKRKEEEAAEERRLAEEEQKFKQGKSIRGCDVVELCRKHGISIHLRTVHNLQQVVTVISGKNGTCSYLRRTGKRAPKLDGCFATAEQLYKHLNEQT